VQIVFTEDTGVDARGKHLNQYGVIRDIVQSHVLQVLALFAMEQPVSLSAEDIRDEKVKRRPLASEAFVGFAVVTNFWRTLFWVEKDSLHFSKSCELEYC
jgi:hypothetical protein